MNSDPGIEADNEHAGPVRSKLSSRMGGRRRRAGGTRTDRISRWMASQGPQVKSSPTLEEDGPDGSEEEETDEREGEGNQHSHPDRDDVDARGEVKVHGAQRETDN